MKRTVLSLLCALVAVSLALCAVGLGASAAVPEYSAAVGYEYSQEKLKGQAIISAAAQEDDTIFLFGSSELSTTMIASHPANFFTANDLGFDLCTVGRGSSQSLIHALILAGCGESLQGEKIVFMISPQHFVEEGIAPDMFVANFSEQQFAAAMASNALSQEQKEYMATRVQDCFNAYEQQFEDPGFEDSRLLAGLVAGGGTMDNIKLGVLSPYLALKGYANGVRDSLTSARVLNSAAQVEGEAQTDFDFDAYRREMAALGAAESDNNEFGILNDYYTTNVGRRLERMANKDEDLSYSQSPEYDDLRLLISLCESFGIDALFVHTPLHGSWSDYCGFTQERRQEYYDNVREILDELGCNYLDLTGNEYEPYYLCDVMHIGWGGWVDINEAICQFYNQN